MLRYSMPALMTLCLCPTLLAGENIPSLQRIPRSAKALNLSGALQHFRTMPFAFESNIGQTDSSVRFIARARGSTVFLKEDEIVLGLQYRSDLESPPLSTVSIGQNKH